MADINGTYRHGTRPMVVFEGQQDGEQWNVTVRSAGFRQTDQTWSANPWPVIERLVARALDSATHSNEAPPVFDMNKPLPAKYRTKTPIKRRKNFPLTPGSLPTWEAPEKP
jgi:hypothetical protein